MTRIAIEATGCDKGFKTVLEGARRALEINKGLELILVAGKDKLSEKEKDELSENYSIPKEIHLELVENTYNPKEKTIQRESSIYKAIEMHKNREVDVVLAPGDTKPTVIYSSALLKRMSDIHSPAIATPLPYNNVLIDAGVNSECEPKHFFQFAIMGKVFSENYLGVKNPLIGILNVGEEDDKGPWFVKEGMELIKKLKNYGYSISDKCFEGTSLENLYGGLVIITNGYAGNIGLKIAEVSLKLPYKVLIDEVDKQSFLFRKLSYIGIAIAHAAMHKPIENLKKNFDWRNYATAPLLGINGNIMICHGRSDEKAIANAITSTEKYLKFDINSKLEEEVARYNSINLS